MKRLFKRLLLTLLVLACIGGGLYLYARFVEPRLVTVEELTVSSPYITQPVRIVAFADVHLGNGIDTARLEEIMHKIDDLSPDMVVFLGDLFDNYSTYTAGDEAEIARVLSLPQGEKYAVYGNHDLGGKAQHVYADIMEQAGYTLLVNQAVQLEGGVNLMGCDDLIFGMPDITGLPREGAFDLLLIHEPDFADRITGVELQLSGHTHGGQVRLPVVDYLVLPAGGKNYIRGSFEKADGGLLYVNRGLGMSILPYRFAALPELTVIDLTGE